MTSETELMRANIRGRCSKGHDARRRSQSDRMRKAAGEQETHRQERPHRKRSGKIADMFGMTLFQLTAVLLQPIDSIKQFKA